MKCTNCGYDNTPEASFCANCGTRLVTEVEPPSPVAELGPPKLPSKRLLVGVIIVVLAITGIGVGLALLSDGTISPLTDTIPVTFPDANLEAAIREAINKPQGSIYPSDLGALTALDARERGISDITGLEYCVNLQVLYLWENNISDISPLVANSGLSAGDTVDLRDNPLSTTSVNVFIPQLEARGVTVINE